MGEVTDSILEGEICQNCGVWMDDFIEDGYGAGYPQTCADCQEDQKANDAKTG